VLRQDGHVIEQPQARDRRRRKANDDGRRVGRFEDERLAGDEGVRGEDRIHARLVERRKGEQHVGRGQGHAVRERHALPQFQRIGPAIV
jgi:hypothetical protein